MEMVWEGSRDLGTDGDLFTGLIRILISLSKCSGRKTSCSFFTSKTET